MSWLGVPEEPVMHRAEGWKTGLREVVIFLPNPGRPDIVFPKTVRGSLALSRVMPNAVSPRCRPGTTRKSQRKPLESLKTDSLTGRLAVAERRLIGRTRGPRAASGLLSRPHIHHCVLRPSGEGARHGIRGF
jgi:hypothetical protein